MSESSSTISGPATINSNGSNSNNNSPDYAPFSPDYALSSSSASSASTIQIPTITRIEDDTVIARESRVDQSEYYDAISRYYEYKEQYETSKARMKSQLFSKSEMASLSWQDKRNKYRQLKPPCINCKRPVGTIFSTKRSTANDNDVRILKAVCGDDVAPCILNIQISIPITNTYQETIAIYKNKINYFKERIIMAKNDLIFGYSKSQNEAIGAFKVYNHLLSDNLTLLQEIMIEFEKFSNNPDKQTQLKVLQTDFYANLETYNNYVNNFKTTNDIQYIKDAVAIYLTMISPQVEQIMNLKYSFSGVEYNETDNTFHLYQPVYTLNENQENYPGAANEEIISFEIVKTFIPIQKRTRRKKQQTKNVKSRNKRRETAEQMDEINSKIISDSVSSASQTNSVSESTNSENTK